MAISGDTIAVGKEHVGVYVFQREGSQWSQQAMIVNPDPFADEFADSVAISGDTLLVGAPGYTEPGLDDRGAAYVFVRTGTVWSFEGRLLHSDPESFDWFGYSVAVSGDTALVGAIGDSLTNDSNDDEGSVTVFVRNAGIWTEEQLLNGGAQNGNAEFGNSVALWNDTALVGSPLDSSASNAGSAHVFVRTGSTWNKQQEFVPSTLKAVDGFGRSVALLGNLALVGAGSQAACTRARPCPDWILRNNDTGSSSRVLALDWAQGGGSCSSSRGGIRLWPSFLSPACSWLARPPPRSSLPHPASWCRPGSC